jgi:hypothetical protein
VDVAVLPATGTAEREAAIEMGYAISQLKAETH